MKLTRNQAVAKTHKIPEIRFEDPEASSLTSFAGLVIFQSLFQRLKLKQRMKKCFDHLRVGAAYPTSIIVLGVVVHLLIGFRKLRDRDYYADDPMVLRLLGLQRIPDVATISRTLAQLDEKSVYAYRELNRELVLERVQQERLARLTLDFDGSVLSTGRHAEGTAIGFNKKKKGARSYYPLFCTFAQTAQIFDMHHRPGNVHDSNGAGPFMQDCFQKVREAAPGVVLEARMDSVFFDEALLQGLAKEGVEFTASVPFLRFPHLKGIIEDRQRWRKIDDTWSYFEIDWKPKCWQEGFRLIAIRQKKAKPIKGALQLDLFEPRSHEFDYQVIATIKTVSAVNVMKFHHGRGSQEGVFAESKTHCQMEYIPVRTLHGNQAYCVSSLLAHNLTRELQMQVRDREHGTTAKRRNLWGFETLGVLRNRIIRRAGRLIRPQGLLTLVMGASQKVRTEIARFVSL